MTKARYNSHSSSFMHFRELGCFNLKCRVSCELLVLLYVPNASFERRAMHVSSPSPRRLAAALMLQPD
jgi:hypothetical protein